MDAGEILMAVQAACPSAVGVAIVDPNDKTTWRIDYAAGATDGQKAAAQAALLAYVAPIIKTLFSPHDVIETLFTPAEQQALYTAAMAPAGWQVAKFISLVTAMPQIDVSSPEFSGDIAAVVTMGLLTQQRAAQIVAGTPPTTD